MPEPASLTWVDDTHFRIGDVAFVCSFEASSPEHFCIRKPRRLVERTVEFLEGFRPAHVVELGVAFGGSAALIELVGSPRKHVGLELSETRVAALDALITRKGWHDTLRLFFGVDQADRARVAAIARDEFRGAPLDLVVDDASHGLDETRASFETLFPLLRPGGVYVIEDWNWQLKIAFALRQGLREQGTARRSAEVDAPERAVWKPDAVAKTIEESFRRPPLETLVAELVLARACSGDAVAEVSVDADWALVRRGPGDLDADGFRVADIYVDRGILGH